MNNDWLIKVEQMDRMNSTPQHTLASNTATPQILTTQEDSFPDFQRNIISSTPVLKEAHHDQVSFITTPSKDVKNCLLLSSWGLPDKVLAQYAQRGIRLMFEWQAECLMLPDILNGGNLVYSAPTSAGKTLVAELLALKCILETKRKVIFILPFVSVAHEKSNYLQKILEPQGVKVGGFMGNQSPPGGFASIDIAICTIEKANSLVNRLLEERATHDLGVVVVDELHMIGDQHRGYLLELLLTKLMYTGRTGKSHSQGIQIIGMSATLPNIDTLAKWLGAQSYYTNFRPTPLQEMVKIGPTLYDSNFKKLKEYDQSNSIPGDEDDILLICRERILEGHSVLIFCPTKSWCENLATTLAEAQAGFICSNNTENGGNSSVINHSALVEVCEQLRGTQVGLDRALEKIVPCSVAFHHAGLTFEEREIIEGAFRQSLIRVLVSTSTLSSGVNLPARLVIVRTPFFQRSLLDVLVYKQMVGRAGRKGVDELGESILMCKPSERSKVVDLFKSAPRKISSCLYKKEGTPRMKNNFSAMKRALLEVIASGVASKEQEIKLYASCTLYFAELEVNTADNPMTSLSKPLSETMAFLSQNDFISSRPQPADIQSPDSGPTQEFYATQLGMATVASALSPDEALVVFGELSKARKRFVLENELHIIYLVCFCLYFCLFVCLFIYLFIFQVAPVYIQNQWPNIDWYKYLCIWERLPPGMKNVSDTIGVKESFLAQAVQGRISERTETQRETLRVHRRFFTALALHDLVHEVPIMQVARRYGATKGLLQTLQSAAGTFAGMVTVFCTKLGWNNLELLLSQFQSRLTFGIERELCDLVKISLLNGFRARVLYNAGYHTLAALATANPIVIETCLRNAIPFKSYKLGKDGDEYVTATGNLWCEKLKKGMTEHEAAIAITNEARAVLSNEFNLPFSAWQSSSRPPQPLQEPAIGKCNQIKPHLVSSNKEPPPGDVSEGCHIRGEAGYKKPCLEDESKPYNPSLLQSDEVNELPVVSGKATRCPDFILASTLLKSTRQEKMETDPHPNHQLDRSSLSLSPITISCIDTLDRGSLMADRYDQENIPFTIPDSLPNSANTSMSYSFQTFAMIDAVCEAEAKFDNSNVIISKPGNQAHSNRHASPELSACSNVPDVLNTISTPLKPENNISRCVPETPSFSFSHFHPSGLKELSSLCSSQLTQSGITVINVTSNRVLFDTFISECLEQKTLAFSMASTNMNRNEGIGSVVAKSKSPSGIPIPLRNEQVVGIAFCWGGMDVYYISLCQDSSFEECENDCHHSPSSIPLEERMGAVKKLFETGQNWEKVIAYDMKKHAKLLALSCGVIPTGKTQDPIVANWMLNPDAEEKTIHRMILQYLPNQPLLSECEDYEEVPLSSLATNGGDPEMRVSAESILAYLLSSKLEVLLEVEGLYNSYVNVEMPLLLVLAKTELNGIGFSPDECTKFRDILQEQASKLEQAAYKMAGHTFSLASPEDIASVLFLELKLPSGPDLAKQKMGTTTRRVTRRRIHHLSTAKDVLEKIRPLHPLPGIVLEWRKISATMTKMVYPLFEVAMLHKDLKSFRIHPDIHIHTATGRVSVSDPCLQMVPKEFNIGPDPSSAEVTSLLSESQYLLFNDSISKESIATHTVCMRDAFQPFPGGVFLAADYSQLELRILAHMSNDTKLKQILNGKDDVFKRIAGEWLNLPPSSISGRQRQEAKQLCYGMVYGIGAKALGEQLGITDNEAAQFMETFKSKYPTMKKYISKVVQDCRNSGYVSTLLGRKRFLPGIHSPNVHVRSQAERQAINSTIQGSAADLVKMAMINIDRKITQLYCNSTTCLLPSNVTPIQHAAYLVLQLHDELIYEVLESDLEEIAGIVRHEMENALELSVRFPVKIETGYSWGKLEPYNQ